MAAGALLLSGCGRSGTPPISSGERYVSSTAEEAYQLGAGDKVRVTVFNEPQLSGEFAVGADGVLSLPLIGNVAATGKTPAEIAATVQQRLGDGYIREPRVAAEITTYRPFFVLGEVSSPGQFPYQANMTALNAIATAQGFTPRANRKTVLIRRFGEQVELEYVLTPELRVWPGDTIRLKERFF